MKAELPLDEDDKRRLVLTLVTRLRCVECGRLYDPKDFVLLHRRQDLWVLSTRCRYCDELCHVVVYLQPEQEPEPLVDLTREEIELADGWPPITAEDVMDVHALLKDYEGDLESLLND